MSFNSSRNTQFEEYVREGITAAKNGQRKLADRLFNRALMLNNSDARPYLWLSTCTDDPKEQIDYLEKAVSLEPGNAAARRALGFLQGKIKPDGSPRAGKPGDDETTGQSFQCQRCGGRMSFDLVAERLTCEYCGATEALKLEKRQVEETEQVLDFALGVQLGSSWAKTEQQFKCERCGALSVLQQGQKAVQCAYCGSNQLVVSKEMNELSDPQAIILMKIDEQEAIKQANAWLGRGVFAPDDLKHSASTIRLRPAYYSCWTFDGTVEVKWTCEVAEGGGNNRHWRRSSGTEMRFFNDVVVSGIKGFNNRDLDRLEFSAPLAEIFRPAHLAGWPAIFYDRSLSDASLVARDKVLRELRPMMDQFVEPGRDKRNISLSSGKWSGLTFKHMLVPVWIGEYTHEGKPYRILVNGSNSKVVGDKPKDPFKVVMIAVIGIILLILCVGGIVIFNSGIF
jgi:DNA-directed RNA polymerase subunit RPC12/RpoP